jgi:hypothetical protein
MRHAFLLSVPLLAYARWRGYSWREEADGVWHGYWAFGQSAVLRTLLPWTLLLDAALAALYKVYLPLWRGCTVVCERFVLDILVDLEVALDRPALHTRLPGSLYARLLPRGSVVVCLDLGVSAICARRPELLSDRCLAARISAYRRLCADYGLVKVSSAYPVGQVGERIAAILGAKGADVQLGYAKLRAPLLRILARNPLLALAAHWGLQSCLYADRTERWVKLWLDLSLTLLVRLLLGRALPAWTAWVVALALAHTANFILNAHLWGLLKHYGLVQMERGTFDRYVERFLVRAAQEPAIASVWLCGSLSQDAWSGGSDLDVRLLRRPGVICGLRACWFLLCERSRATWARFPLDAYVVDSKAGLAARGVMPTDQPVGPGSWRALRRRIPAA